LPEDSFDDFWNACPKKTGKLKARQKFNKLIRDGTATAEQMTEAMRVYAESSQVKRGYIKHPATWLTGGHWLDEPEAEPQEWWKDENGNDISGRISGNGHRPTERIVETAPCAGNAGIPQRMPSILPSIKPIPADEFDGGD
jgi:hypothetical protein